LREGVGGRVKRTGDDNGAASVSCRRGVRLAMRFFFARAPGLFHLTGGRCSGLKKRASPLRATADAKTRRDHVSASLALPERRHPLDAVDAMGEQWPMPGADSLKLQVDATHSHGILPLDT